MADKIWAAFVRRVAVANHTLTAEVARDLLALTPSLLPGVLGAPEYLLPLDVHGAPVPVHADVLAMVRRTLTGCTEPRTAWLRPAVAITTAGDAVETLLVARRLHHRIGLRHRTVQLILDHPTQSSMTLIQVRGLDKVEAPGAFDMPCAGHVVGLETAAATLAKELAEELGLALDDLDDLRTVGEYEYPEPGHAVDPDAGFHNVEVRTVYRARLKPGALARVHFADGEVAALAMVTRSAIPHLVADDPARVASGLRGTLPWYTGL